MVHFDAFNVRFVLWRGTFKCPSVSWGLRQVERVCQVLTRRAGGASKSPAHLREPSKYIKLITIETGNNAPTWFLSAQSSGWE